MIKVMNKYRLGRKQKRVILDENGHEVAIFNRKHIIEAKLCCDSLNKIITGNTVKFCEGLMGQLLHEQYRDIFKHNYCPKCGLNLSPE